MAATTTPDPSRFIGALLGGAIGDALGYPCEGKRPETVADRYGYVKDYVRLNDGIAEISDDTQLTMCVVECLTLNGYLDPADLARRFVEWLPHGRGKGHATVEAVVRLQNRVPWHIAGADSAGNGAAMRSAPIGLARWNDPLLLRAEATISALPTHRNPMGVAGAVAMAAATAFMVGKNPGDWKPEDFIGAVQQAIAGIETEPQAERRDPAVLTTLHDRIGDVPSMLDWEPKRAFDRLYNGAFVLESLPAALYCFLGSPDDAEQVLCTAVNGAHDADTVAAMAGTLCGALLGEPALPPHLVERVEYRDELRALGRALHSLAVSGDITTK
jgi:ADP-ribosyl-[dinitrogen reductase] hydrolase